MTEAQLLIATGNLRVGLLAGQAAVVTGAGGGIGYEAARALIWLGARVIIAEIDVSAGESAAARLNAATGAGKARFIHTDVGDETSVARLAQAAWEAFGAVDIVINNATIAPLGSVAETPIETWDRSYRVNLRGPVLLARAFIPGMIERGRGAFVCVSSTGAAYMGAYETLKAAQVHLATTLDAELEGTGVAAFTIGPGFAPTQTASGAIPKLAALLGQSEAALAETLTPYTLSVEAAGAGFAAAVAMAERYRGQEISSIAALIDAGIDVRMGAKAPRAALSSVDLDEIRTLAVRVRTTLAEQSAGWQARSLFERQWLVRTFRKQAGRPVEGWLELLAQVEAHAAQGDAAGVLAVDAPWERLVDYYAQLAESARGYVKNPTERENQVGIVLGWQEDVEALAAKLKDREDN